MINYLLQTFLSRLLEYGDTLTLLEFDFVK